MFERATKKDDRDNYVVSSQILSDDDENISTPVESSLFYNEFELLPRMRET
jgi:hypothetical protein